LDTGGDGYVELKFYVNFLYGLRNGKEARCRLVRFRWPYDFGE